jgi:Short C-terminal domain
VFRARRIMRRRAIERSAAKRSAGADQEREAPEVLDEAPEPAAAPADQIKELAELREQGILTEEEFAAEQKRLLGSQ